MFFNLHRTGISVLLFVLVWIQAGACAQSTQTLNPDSIAVVDGNWKYDTLSPGLVLKTLHIQDTTLFKSNQLIHILEIDTARTHSAFGLASSDTLTHTSAFCKKKAAFAAINGTFFYMKSGKSTDYLRVNNKKIADNSIKDNKRKSYKNGLLAIQSGLLEIILPDTNLFFEDHLPHENIMTSGPMLLFNRQQLDYIQNSFTCSRHNRTGVAVTADNRIWMIVVDGKAKEAAGMSLKEFGDAMKWLGAITLLNLDGGGSSTMFINKKEYGIVNYPSDNGKFDKKGERRVANALLLYLPK